MTGHGRRCQFVKLYSAVYYCLMPRRRTAHLLVDRDQTAKVKLTSNDDSFFYDNDSAKLYWNVACCV